MSKRTKSKSKAYAKRISTQLLSVIIPTILAAIAVVALFISLNAKDVIVEEATNGLKQEAKKNAADIAGDMEGIIDYYDGFADTFSVSSYSTDADILKALEPGMAKNPDVVSDLYIAFGKDSFYDGSGWVPDADYDPTTRAWYKNGSNSTSIFLGPPSVDLTTGQMVVCGSRKVELSDGRSGVMSADISLKGISARASAYKPLGTGSTMMFDGTIMIASPVQDQIGKDVSEYPNDNFIQEISKITTSGGRDDVFTLHGTDGSDYYVSIDAVNNTNWFLASFVKVNDVLAPLYKFIIISIIIALVILLGIAIALSQLIGIMITRPVRNLTDNITRIAQGDFTVEIQKDNGTNEIAVMNNNMLDYVDKMRKTLLEIKDVSLNLADEASNSQNASSDLNMQADEQLRAMQQINGAMDDMANAVTDLANQATNLAQKVANLSSNSQQTKDTMSALVTKAKEGQHDMKVVQNGMTGIAKSIDDMNEVVINVGDSAQKINSIVDMINEISGQTNLLSLNASIEAARAGEAGKGFAVVAQEIGQLAQNSASSTQQISEIIKDITLQIEQLSNKSQSNMKEIDTNMKAVDTAGDTFEDIFKNLDATSDIVSDMISKIGAVDDIASSMAAISEEQSANTQQVSSTVTNVTASAEQVAESSKGVDASAAAVSDSSNKIEELISVFKL
ncbi:MAG: methyl-accepting chemotaxis protein [Lachnospiraceae bacterium]|nr:methyl-accepting chemotaxis protein [Lachnospiraceae bacterium]